MGAWREPGQACAPDLPLPSLRSPGRGVGSFPSAATTHGEDKPFLAAADCVCLPDGRVRLGGSWLPVGAFPLARKNCSHLD